MDAEAGVAVIVRTEMIGRSFSDCKASYMTYHTLSGVPKIRTSTPDTGEEASPQSSTPAETPIKDQASSKTSDDAPKATENREKTLDQSNTDAPATAGSNEDAPSSTKKRAREEEGDETPAETPAKKVDIKDAES